MRRRRFTLVIALIVAIFAIHDFAVPHGRGFAARSAIFLIDEYRAHMPMRVRRAFGCRFEPTCSAYGRAAISKYGFGKGFLKTVWRIAKCGPWTEAGTVDLP